MLFFSPACERPNPFASARHRALRGHRNSNNFPDKGNEASQNAHSHPKRQGLPDKRADGE